MEYRLVRLDNSDDYVQIYDEKEAHLIGSVIKSKRYGLARKYLIRINETTYELVQGLFFRKKWKITPSETQIKFKWLGKAKISTKDAIYHVDDINRGKLTVKSEQQRTTIVIDSTSLTTKEMVLLETYDRLQDDLCLVLSVLLVEKFHLW